MENSAQQWTDQVSSEECGKKAVTLTKMPDAGHSENDVYISFSTKETDAVIAWAPNATDYTNIRTMRVRPLARAQSSGLSLSRMGPHGAVPAVQQQVFGVVGVPAVLYSSA